MVRELANDGSGNIDWTKVVVGGWRGKKSGGKATIFMRIKKGAIEVEDLLQCGTGAAVIRCGIFFIKVQGGSVNLS